jgi:DNA-binding LacI/PurR family transcriptional regulator
MAMPEVTVMASRMPVVKRTTILDVARACGVAKSTVSVVLNQSPAASRVPEETRQRVRSIASQLGYRASWRGRALAARRTHMIGVLYVPPMPLIARGNYEGILSGINEVLQARGYHLLLMPLGDNPLEWRRVLLDQRMDGAIVLSRLLPELADILVGAELPVTLVNADSELDLPKVLADEYHGARETMEYLFSLGHRRVAFLLGDQPPHYSVNERLRGYRDALAGAGLSDLARVQAAGDAADFADAFVSLSADERPTAVVCYTHYLAIKLLQELWSRGLSVPRDLSVSCFSNAYPVADVVPPLTTVALATEQMGRTAAELVLEQIETGRQAPKRRVVLHTRLVVRQSTAAPGASGPESARGVSERLEGSHRDAR